MVRAGGSDLRRPGTPGPRRHHPDHGVLVLDVEPGQTLTGCLGRGGSRSATAAASRSSTTRRASPGRCGCAGPSRSGAAPNQPVGGACGPRTTTSPNRARSSPPGRSTGPSTRCAMTTRRSRRPRHLGVASGPQSQDCRGRERGETAGRRGATKRRSLRLFQHCSAFCRSTSGDRLTHRLRSRIAATPDPLVSRGDVAQLAARWRFGSGTQQGSPGVQAPEDPVHVQPIDVVGHQPKAVDVFPAVASDRDRQRPAQVSEAIFPEAGRSRATHCCQVMTRLRLTRLRVPRVAAGRAARPR
jgi:hypothetical protein